MRIQRIPGAVSGVMAALLMLSLSPYAIASCVPLSGDGVLPQVIGAGQCYELSGGFILRGRHEIEGTVLARARDSLTLAENASLEVKDGGRFISRGALTLKHHASLSVSGKGHFEAFGALTLEKGALLGFKDEATGRLVAESHLFNGSALALSDRALLRQQSRLTLTDALLIAGGGKFINEATLELRGRSELRLKGESRLVNEGRLNTDAPCLIALEKRAYFANGGLSELEGSLSLSQDSRFENHARCAVQGRGAVYAENSASLYNGHVFNLAGRLYLNDTAEFKNGGTFTGFKGGSLRLLSQARLVNAGTLTDQGLTLEGEERVVNTMILNTLKAETGVSSSLKPGEPAPGEGGAQSVTGGVESK